MHIMRYMRHAAFVDVFANPRLVLVEPIESFTISSSQAPECDPVTVKILNDANADSVAMMSLLCCMALVVAYVLLIGM